MAMEPADALPIEDAGPRRPAHDGATRFGQYLARSLLAVLAGLPVGSFFGGLLLSFYGFATESAKLSDFPAAIGASFLIALVAAFIGIVPAFVYGAPLYALLAWRRCANYLSALLIGILPGAVLMLLWGWPVAWWVLLFGPCVAIATHYFARQHLIDAADRHANADGSSSS